MVGGVVLCCVLFSCGVEDSYPGDAEGLAAVELPAAPGGAAQSGAVRFRVAEQGSRFRNDAHPRRSVVTIGGDGLGAELLERVLVAALERESAGAIEVHVRHRRDGILLRELETGTLDLGLTTAKLTHRDRRRGLEQHKLEQFAFVPVVHPSNRLYDLRLDQVAQILAGQLQSWVSINHARVDLEWVGSVGTPLGELVARVFPGKRLAGHASFESARSAAAYVAKHRGAIAFLLAADARQPGVRSVAVASVRPTPLSVAEARYPLRLTLRLWATDSPTRATRRVERSLRFGRAAGLLGRLVRPSGRAWR